MSLDQEADAFVRDMAVLGATFDISRGPRGASWFYAARPGMRDALRRHKATLDINRPGFSDAVVRAVLRTKFASVP